MVHKLREGHSHSLLELLHLASGLVLNSGCVPSRVQGTNARAEVRAHVVVLLTRVGVDSVVDTVNVLNKVLVHALVKHLEHVLVDLGLGLLGDPLNNLLAKVLVHETCTGELGLEVLAKKDILELTLVVVESQSLGVELATNVHDDLALLERGAVAGAHDGTALEAVHKLEHTAGKSLITVEVAIVRAHALGQAIGDLGGSADLNSVHQFLGGSASGEGAHCGRSEKRRKQRQQRGSSRGKAGETGAERLAEAKAKQDVRVSTE
mmetsp:Transcript_12998/g.22379  ORF Transcript_12998/g.22379 Transcript_12998/m.22379 type:complete len:264 (+) Transcript_12998:581-1372(+)